MALSVEAKEAAPVVSKPPMAVPKFGLAGVTADVLSELRRKTGKQPAATQDQEVFESLSASCQSDEY